MLSIRFIVVRYAGLLAAFPSLFFIAIQSQHCKVAMDSSQAGVVLVVASSGIIFGYRVSAIWNANKIVIAIVGFFYICMVASWVGVQSCGLGRSANCLYLQLAVATQYRIFNGQPTPFGSNCQMLPIITWAPICYASSVVFDIVILIFSLTKLKAHTSGVGFVVYRDSLMYFFATAITNIAVLTVQALGSKYNLIKPAAVPFSTLMVTTMASRVFLNLKLFNQRQARAEQGLPVSVDSYQMDSEDHRMNDKVARHPIPIYPRPPKMKTSLTNGSPDSSTMPINITRETYVAL